MKGGPVVDPMDRCPPLHPGYVRLPRAENLARFVSANPRSRLHISATIKKRTGPSGSRRTSRYTYYTRRAGKYIIIEGIENVFV